MRNPDWTDEENLIVYAYILKFPNKNHLDLAKEIRKLHFENGVPFINEKRSVSAIEQHITELKKREDQLYVPDPKKD